MAQEMRFLGYTAAAAGVGYVAGILFAPKSGRQLRQDIATTAKKVSNKTAARLNEGKEKVKAFIEQARGKAEEAGEKGTRVLGDLAHTQQGTETR